MDINIRKATDKDLPSVYSLIKEFAAYLGKSDSVMTKLEDLEREKKHFDCFLAENEKGKLMGYALFFSTFHSWTGKSIYVDDLFIKEEYRRLSVGTMLACAVIDYAKRTDSSELRWLVSKENKAAINFYKKLGASISDDKLNCIYSLR